MASARVLATTVIWTANAYLIYQVWYDMIHSHGSGWQYYQPNWGNVVGVWSEFETCPLETDRCSDQTGGAPHAHQQQTMDHPINTHLLLCKLLWTRKWTSKKTTNCNYYFILGDK